MHWFPVCHQASLICACVLIFLIIIFPQILWFIVICAIDLDIEIYVKIDAMS